MAASLVITKEEIEIFIYQQSESELLRWCAASLGKESERGAPLYAPGGVGFPISTQMNYARAAQNKKSADFAKERTDASERAGAHDNEGIIAAYLFCSLTQSLL